MPSAVTGEADLERALDQRRERMFVGQPSLRRQVGILADSGDHLEARLARQPHRFFRFVLNGEPISLEALWKVALEDEEVRLSDASRERMTASRKVVQKALAEGETVYGINTGFGKLSDVHVEPSKLKQLQLNLVRSHSCGVGDPLSVPEVRAMMLLRANVLSLGFSGARPELAEFLARMLNEGSIPRVPEKGSVGASGDLAPLAHLALAMIGEGEAAICERQLAAVRERKPLSRPPVIPMRRLSDTTAPSTDQTCRTPSSRPAGAWIAATATSRSGTFAGRKERGVATSRPFTAREVPRSALTRRSGAGGTAGRPSVARRRKKSATSADLSAERSGRPLPRSATNETKTAVARTPLAARFQRPPTRQTIGSVMFMVANATNAR